MISISKIEGDRVPWFEITNGITDESKKWVQVIQDYNPERYEYNWKSDFLPKTDRDDITYIVLSDVESGDTIKVSGQDLDGKVYSYYRVDENNEDKIVLDPINEETAKDRVKKDYDNLEELVKEEIEQASQMKLERVYALLQE